MHSRSSETPDPSMTATPMMAQYLEIKAANPGLPALLPDGRLLRDVLRRRRGGEPGARHRADRRGRHNGADIPMCGVPIHAADGYLQKLIARGFRVAVCEQIEDPAEARKRGGKAVVRRERDPAGDAGDADRGRASRCGPQQLPRRRRPPARRRRCRRSVRARLDRHIDRRVPRRGERWRPPRRRPRPHRAARIDRRRAALRRRRPRTVLAGIGLRRDAARRRPFSMGPPPASGSRPISASKTLDGYGSFSRAGARRRRRGARLCREDAARRAPAALAAVGRGGGRRHADRRRDTGAISRSTPRSRATAKAAWSLRSTAPSPAPGRACWRSVSRAPRPTGRRSRAASTASPGCSPTAAAARRSADELAPRARPRPRPRPRRPRSRRSARPCRDRDRPRDGGARSRRSLESAGDLPDELAVRGERSAAERRAALASALVAALADSLPHLKRDGGFVRDGYRADLDEARKLRDDSRRVIAGLQARIRRRDRHPRAQDQAQQRPRLFHRGRRQSRRQAAGRAAQRPLHPPPDAGQRLPLHHHRARRARGEDRRRRPSARWRSNSPSSTNWRRRSPPRPIGSAPSPTRSPSLDVAAALAVLAEAENYCRPEVEASLAFAVAGGRHPVVEQALRGERPALRRQRLRPRPRRRSRADLAGHRAEHGRQVDLPPPERAHRHPRADRLVRAGEVGADRHRRPPVQPRRRRRRPRPRPLDLHGRDGRDRRDPQPGRPALAGHPRRDRPRHGDLRRPVDRLGGDRASPRE